MGHSKERETTVLELPSWVPRAAQNYLAHTEAGKSIRSLARDAGCHASTILRQVRRYEQRRDDLLVDLALKRLGRGVLSCAEIEHLPKDQAEMMMTKEISAPVLDDVTVMREARRILRRLNEPGACLAVAKNMEKAVVAREDADGRTIRTAVVDRPVAEAMALKDWIIVISEGRIMRYKISTSGRLALKRLIAEEEAKRVEDRDFGASFADQHREMGERDIRVNGGAKKRVRYNMTESPLLALSRRKDKDGTAFLGPDLVAAGERLREDFELAQMGPRIAQNWDRFLTGGARGDFNGGNESSGSAAARERVTKALADLGPGLGDVVLRCCCFLEGMEAAERRMGWSARSGKIVLRIALNRLKSHYDEAQGNWSPMIG